MTHCKKYIYAKLKTLQEELVRSKIILLHFVL